MKNLFDTDYVIYNKSTDWVASYSQSGNIIIYGNLEEALEDCKYEGEEAVKCTDLPEHHKELLTKQIQTT
jgi:hypothetical protein